MHRISFIDFQITSKTMTSFALFPELPLELQLKIWRCAARQPRIIELAWHSQNNFLVIETSPNPILQACRTARYETIASFDVVQLYGSPQRFRLNYSHDTIFFGPSLKQMVGMTTPWSWIHPLLTTIIMWKRCLHHFRTAAFDTKLLLAMDEQGRKMSFGK